MSAETLGEELLREVEEEDLHDLLNSLRALEPSSTSSSPTGVPALDQLLNIFHNDDAAQQQRHSHHNNTQSSHIPSGNQTKSVLEITGISITSSGKTQLLCYLITLALLPHHTHPDNGGLLLLNGKGSAVILLDLSSSRFPVLRLRDIMRAYIEDCISTSLSTNTTTITTPPPSETEISTLIHSSLRHLHIFSPDSSSSSVLATLSSLPSYLLTQPFAHSSSNRRISLLVLNDLSAFLWRQDRQESIPPPTNNETPTSNNTNNTNLPHLHYHRTLISSLRSLQSLLSCHIITTGFSLATPSPLLAPNTNNSNQNHQYLALRPHLPALWTKFRTAQLLILPRAPVQKLRAGISAQEAESDERAERRLGGGERGGSGGRESGWRGRGSGERIGRVNWWGSEGWAGGGGWEGRGGGSEGSEQGWTEHLKESIKNWELTWGGGIRFRIGIGKAGGVHVEDVEELAATEESESEVKGKVK